MIAHLYEEEGPDFVRSLHGMFGLAIWDARREELLLARDRLGKKPLFYARAASGRSRFASELWALLADPEISTSSIPIALDRFFAFSYVPARERLPRGAQAAAGLAPALARRTGPDRAVLGGRLTPATLDVNSEAEAGELVRSAVRDAVRRRMVADVPLGAFLSGGVDSTAVVAAMAQLSTEPVKTFSIGFESERLRRAARMRGRSPSTSAPITTSSSSDRTRSSCCRPWSAITASRSPTTRRFRASTWRRWRAVRSPWR